MDKTLYIDSYIKYRNDIAALIEKRVYKVFRHIADVAFQQCKNTNTIAQHVAHFQNALSFVSKWTPVESEQELQIFMRESGLTDFQECIACLYVLQLRNLVDVKPGMQRHSITVDIMESIHFLHMIYVSCARLMWKQAILFGCTFSPTVTNLYQQRIKELLLEEIKRTIDELIPIQTIQRALLEPYDDVREEVRTEMIETPAVLAPAQAPAPALPMPPQESFFFAPPAPPEAFNPPPPPPPPAQLMPAPPPRFTTPILATTL